MEETPHFKIVMLGESGVGKTALLERVSDGSFSEGHIPTIGAQYTLYQMDVGGKQINLELWDTAGQEVYISLVSFYARDTHGAILTFDLADKNTFEALGKWVKFARDSSPDIKIIVFGNKLDLIEDSVPYQSEIDDFVERNSLVYIEGSAKTGQNVAEAFTRMGEFMLDMIPEMPTDTSVRPTVEKTEGRKCC